MKILMVEWNAYMQKDIKKAFTEMGVSFAGLSYAFRSNDEDGRFRQILASRLGRESFSAVLSINYLPVIADVCRDFGLPYLAWCYDSPLNFKRADTLSYPTNFVFLFDLQQYWSYKRMGYDTVYHMPLAVDAARMEQIDCEDGRERFEADAAFVGRLYPSNFDYLSRLLPEYCRGYLEGVLEVQKRFFTQRLFAELMTEDFAAACSKAVRDRPESGGEEITAESLRLTLATHITQGNRLRILGELSKRCRVALYTTEDSSMLPQVENRGTAFYYSDMPRIFKLSKINLNITFRMIGTGIPLRALDILGAGGFLLTDWQEEMGEYLEPDRDMAVYGSVEELLDKADYYLAHEGERMRIAQNGHEKALRYFGYRERIAQMFSTAGLL